MKYTEGWKYQLHDDFSVDTRFKVLPRKDIITKYIELYTTGILIIKNGYAWNGPSGFTIDTPDSMIPSLIHDALYQLMGEGLLDPNFFRLPSDILFREILKECGMNWVRRVLWFKAVRKHGGSHVTGPRPVYEIQRVARNHYKRVTVPSSEN